MSAQPTAAAAGTIDVGGDLTVNRLGFGAMRITGPGIWGDPPSRDQAIATLRRVVELGVNFIDTADSYGPEVSETLIAEALHPYPDDLVIATKGGLIRPGPNRWEADGRPEHLREVCEGSLRRLQARADPAVPVPPPRPGGAAGRVARRDRRAEERGQDPARRGLQRVGVPAARGAGDRPDRVGAEPVQRVRPQVRVDDRPVRAGAAGVPALGADPGDRQEPRGGGGRRAARRDPAPGRAGLAAGHLAADPAHPGHRLAQARGGEHRRRVRRADPDEVDAISKGALPAALAGR